MTSRMYAKALVADDGAARNLRRVMLFFAILLSGGNLVIPRAPVLVLLLLTIAVIASPIKALRPELARVWLLLFVILLVSIIGAGAIHIEETIIRYANFLAAIFILVVYLDLGRGEMMRDALPIFVFFSIQSILTPILAIFADFLFMNFTVGETVYHTLGFIFTYHETVGEAEFIGLRRSNGFFFEPGVFQIYLNLFLYLALFYKRSLLLSGLAIGGVLATQSTTGIVISFMLCGLAALDRMRRMQASSALLFFVSAPIILLPIAWLTYQNVVAKLFGAAAGSATARSFDAQASLLIIGEYPIFGIGFSHERFGDEIYRFGRAIDTVLGAEALERSITNGILQVAVTLGIPIAIVFITALCRQRIFGNSLVVGGLLVLSMMTEPLLLTPFFLAIAFSGLLMTPQRTVARSSVPHRGHRAGALR